MRASFHRLDVPVGDAEPLVDAHRARGLVLMEPDLHVLREPIREAVVRSSLRAMQKSLSLNPIVQSHSMCV